MGFWTWTCVASSSMSLSGWLSSSPCSMSGTWCPNPASWLWPDWKRWVNCPTDTAVCHLQTLLCVRHRCPIDTAVSQTLLSCRHFCVSDTVVLQTLLCVRYSCPTNTTLCHTRLSYRHCSVSDTIVLQTLLCVRHGCPADIAVSQTWLSCRHCWMSDMIVFQALCNDRDIMPRPCCMSDTVVLVLQTAVCQTWFLSCRLCCVSDTVVLQTLLTWLSCRHCSMSDTAVLQTLLNDRDIMPRPCCVSDTWCLYPGFWPDWRRWNVFYSILINTQLSSRFFTFWIFSGDSKRECIASCMTSSFMHTSSGQTYNYFHIFFEYRFPRRWWCPKLVLMTANACHFMHRWPGCIWWRTWWRMTFSWQQTWWCPWARSLECHLLLRTLKVQYLDLLREMDVELQSTPQMVFLRRIHQADKQHTHAN